MSNIQQGQEIKRKLILMLILTMLISMLTPMTATVHADGAVYYVGGAGASDDNPGTASEPFATIQKAADVAIAGDTVKIRGGTYRETIVPANSGTADHPIVYEPDGDAEVTISGTDVADGGWEQVTGDIYKKSISLTEGYNDSMSDNATLMANQVFVNGEMMIEARWPNLSSADQLFDRTKLRDGTIGTWSTSGAQTLIDDAIPDIDGGWTGGTIWVNGWYVSQTRTITAHEGNQLTLSGSIITDNKKRELYYLTGRLGALDTEKEFFYGNGELYLWQPGGGSPEGVEVKKRNYAFDLSGKSHITINKIKVFAAAIISDAGSAGITLDGLNAKHINHNVTLTDADVIYSHTGQIVSGGAAGIRLLGDGSIIKNSEIAFTSNMGIVLGTNATAHNNLVHDIGYDGTYASAIAPLNGASGQRITNNTIYRTGRSSIDVMESRDVEIGYNDMSQFGMLNNDLGAIYSARNSDTTGMRIHHNWIHDHSASDLTTGINTGIYFDQNSGPALIDHNVIKFAPGARTGDLYVQHLADRDHTHRIYNNTLASTGVQFSYKIANHTVTDKFDEMRNNIMRDEYQVTYVPHTPPGTNTLYLTTDPLFQNQGGGSLAYRLSSTSPAVDAGAELEGITDDYVGEAPDIGAYERGGTEWVAGYVAPGNGEPGGGDGGDGGDGGTIEGNVYYVGGDGASDDNPGTAGDPFATIQKAADVATAGDTVKIRGGTYRETIVPANSGTADHPIVYEPDGDAVVTVSGADVVEGEWTLYEGNIYKKNIAMTNGYNDNMTSNTTLLANQVFVDGKMMIEARWPNVANSDDLMDRTDWRAASNGDWQMTAGGMTVTDEGIPDIPGGWAGGQLWLTGWYVSQTRAITAQTGKELTLAGSEIIANKREFYYLTGRLGALDTAKEWHYDGTDLYLWAPDGNMPEGVEVKARNYAFDLSGKSHIALTNIHIFAASIITDNSSSHITIDGLRAKYINHNVTLTDSDVIYTHTDQAGIRLIGPSSMIKNSVVEYSSNMGIVLGAGNVARNNLVHDIGYDGTYASAISPLPGTSNHQILYNTVFRVGRSAVDMLHTKNVEIGYNDFYDYGLITNDGGAIYSARESDLTGTEVHHNWIHNSKALRGGQGGEKGIYYDQGSGPVLTHHNVLWGNEEDYYNHHDPLEQVNPPKVFETYNNTFGSMEYASYVTYQVPPTDIAANNIYRDAILASDNATFAVKENVDPKFKNSDSEHGGLKYQLLADSPAVNKGTVIAGITDGYIGSAPDIGAYELGGEAWVPGYQAEGWVPNYYATEGPLPPTIIDEDALSPQGTILIDDAVTGTEDFQYEFVGAWKTSANPVAYKETDHYARIQDDYYVVRFTGTQIHVYGEKNNAFGIVAVSIDDGEETLVDAYSPTQIPDTLLYSSPVLAYGSHTLKVRLTGDKNEASASTYHTADKVLVVTGAVTIDDAATGTEDFQYEFVGAWKTSANPVAYKETDHYTRIQDDYYVVRFTGTQIHVYGEKNNAFGIVAVSIDDGEETLVDAYSPTQIPNTLLYSSPTLAYGSHTLKVRLTGDKNEASASTYHTADRVVVVTERVTIDDADEGVELYHYGFVGNWRTSANVDAYKETDHYNDRKDDYYTVTFTGSQIHVYGEKRNSFGIVAVSVDDGEETLVDAYSDVRLPNTLLYVSPVLPHGSHTLKIRLTGERNALSTHTYHTADRVVITTADLSAEPAPDTTSPVWPVDAALTVSSVSQTAVTLTWPAATDDTEVSEYEVYLDDAEAPIAEVAGDVHSYRLTGLTANRTYSFTVVATDEAGNLSEGLSATSKTLAEPEQPTTTMPTPTPTPTPEPSPTPAPLPMPADAEEHWSADAVNTLAKLGAIKVDGEGNFRPEQSSTRAEFIDMLVRALRLQPQPGTVAFADIEQHWAKESIAIAKRLGLISGYSDTTFGPEDDISREQMAVILVRALRLEDTAIEETELAFTDADKVSPWAARALAIAVEQGLIRGYPNGSFQPQRALSRAEAAAIIVRILDRSTD